MKNWVVRLTSLALAALWACSPRVVPDAWFPQEEVADIPLILPSDSLHPWYGEVSPAVYEFYKRRSFQPVWIDHEPAIDSLENFIANIRYAGLLPGNYHYDAIRVPISPSWNRMVRLSRDVLLTDAFVSLYLDLSAGRTTRHTQASRLRALHALPRLVEEGRVVAALRGVEPTYTDYRWLRKGLAAIIDAADSGNRQQLQAGEIIGVAPVFTQVAIVEANLERWRQERKSFGTQYVWVNVPSLMVEVFDQDRIVMTSRAIVGKPGNETPSFSSTIQCFITYPYWHVPRRIAVEEFLPFLQRDTTFITRNNFDVINRAGKVLNADSIPWKRYSRDYFPVILRQREGSDNSLGIVKFQFDNPYAVFIHDTNAPRLFRRDARALSHGCIRMEKAVDLAHYLVTGSTEVRSPLVAGYLREKQRHTVDLAKAVPVHIRYFTAAFRNGKVVFYKDIYGRDQDLIRRLNLANMSPTSSQAGN